MTWLIAGLGNPGERYRDTRHNVGARVVDALAARDEARFRKARFIPLEVGEVRVGGAPVLLVKPLVFMNVSGPPIASLARRRGVGPDGVVACHDDIDLTFGGIKLKRAGSTAGHHGLDSLAAGLRTPDFCRVRLGVGRPPGRQDPADFVLEPFSKRERPEVDLMVEEAADAVLALIREGLEAAQDRYNRSGVR